MTDLGFKNAQDMDDQWHHWFFYGPTGSGKTTLAATFPRPVFILPKNEGSIVTLRGMDIPYYEVVDMDKTPLRDGVGSMCHILDTMERAYHKDPESFPFDTIVIESVSHYSDLVIEQLTNGGKLHMDQPKWGILTAHLRNIQSRLRNMDVNVVFTALDAVKEQDDGSVTGGPLIQGASAKKLPSSCDAIGYCEEKGGGNNTPPKYRVHFRRKGAFAARTRLKGIPPKIDNFNFAEVDKLLRKNN